MKKQITLLLSSLAIFSAVPVANADTESQYYSVGVAYSSKIGSSPGTALPSSYDDITKSTVVISAAAYYNATRNEGWERGRIWSRPDYVKPWLETLNGYSIARNIRTTNAVMQFQSPTKDGILWIDGSDPSQDLTS